MTQTEQLNNVISGVDNDKSTFVTIV